MNEDLHKEFSVSLVFLASELFKKRNSQYSYQNLYLHIYLIFSSDTVSYAVLLLHGKPLPFSHNKCAIMRH